MDRSLVPGASYADMRGGRLRQTMAGVNKKAQLTQRERATAVHV